MFRAMLAVALMAVSTLAIELSPDNFDSVALADKPAFVKFFAPWCGHCKRMAPAWDKLMGEEDSAGRVVVGNVDCTVHRDLCTRFGVRGFPTLKTFKAGNTEGEDYRGGRSYDDLKKHVDAL